MIALRFLVLISIPIGLAGITQLLGIFSFYDASWSGVGGAFGPYGFWRASGTLGNPVFYGSYLSVIIFLSILLALWEEKPRAKIFFWIISGFNLVMLLLSQTRGAWIGTFFGCAFLLTIWLLFSSSSFDRLRTGSREKQKLTILVFIFLIVFSFFLFILLSEVGYLPETAFFGRYKTIFDNLIDFKNARVFVWKLGIGAFKDSPVFGFGPESLSYIYDKYYQANFLPYVPESLWFDRAHNKVIDTLVFSGGIGLIGYLSIFGAAIFLLLKHRNKNNSLSSYVLIALLLAYFVQNLFAFDTIAVSIVMFSSLGLVEVIFRKEEGEGGEKITTPILQGAKIRKGPIMISGIIIAILTVYTIFAVNFRPLKANLELTNGRNLIAANKIKEGMSSLEKSFSGRDFSSFENRFFSAVILYTSSSRFVGSVKPEEVEAAKIISEKLEKILKEIEQNLEGRAEIKQMNGYLLMAQAYKTLYLIEDKDKRFLDEEERILGKALKFNPQFPKIYRLAAEMRFLQDKEKEGMVFLAKAYSLDKNLASFYEWLAISLLESGQKEEGAMAMRKTMRLGDFYTEGRFNMGLIWEIANIYEEKKDYRQMEKFYEEVFQFYPANIAKSPQLYASLATVYAELGEIEKAREITNEMLRMFPQLKSQSEEFLRHLEK